MKTDIKDTVEMIAVNGTGIGISLTDIDSILRTLILLATLVYTIIKVRHYIKSGKK